MTTRHFVDLSSAHITEIKPERLHNGKLVEVVPRDRYHNAKSTQLHAYGQGPFCRFRVRRGRYDPGLYVLTLDGNLVYAAEYIDFGKRWGPNGYGAVAPRNRFQEGRATNCCLNTAILIAAREGTKIDLWFCKIDSETTARRVTETKLIQVLSPPWNRAKMSPVSP